MAQKKSRIVPKFQLKKKPAKAEPLNPHHSFHLTRRRDYKRPLHLPGYWKFTSYVAKTLWQHRKTFLLLAVVYSVLSAILIGLASQTAYAQLTDSLRSASGDIFGQGWQQLGQTLLVFAGTIGSSFSAQNASGGGVETLYGVMIALMIWLTTVWLLRNFLANKNVKLRDGLYSAGAPLFATYVLALVLLVQLIPIALAFLAYSAASSTGLLNHGAEAMLFWFAAGGLTLLSLYWMTSTLFGMIIVTLPGMYPFIALARARDVVLGRRTRLLLRTIWLALMVLLGWVVILLPIIFIYVVFSGWWSWFESVPLIPVAILLLSALTTIWVSGYIYLLYRTVVDNNDR